MSKIIINEDDLDDLESEVRFDSDDYELDYLVVRESYCMACDSPLRSYRSLICSGCLHDGVNILSNLVDSLNFEDSKFVIVKSENEIEADEADEADEDFEEEKIEEEDLDDEDEDSLEEDFEKSDY